MASSATPKLIIPEEKSTTPSATKSSTNSSDGTTTKKLTKLLSTQSSFDRYHSQRPVAKRFSIDADPSSIILNNPVTDLSNNLAQHLSTTEIEENSSNSIRKPDRSPSRSPSLKKSDSFLEIPYEKGEIADLINLVDDPNASTHITNDGQEVLLEHGVAP